MTETRHTFTQFVLNPPIPALSWIFPMKEYQPPDAPLAADPRQGKVPISAYFLAVISGLFVTFGVIIVAAFSPMFLGDWTQTAPPLVVAAIPFSAVALGILSAWQSIRQAKRKALAKAKKLA